MNVWSKYWLIWSCTAFASFIIPELWAIFTGHSENTLSAQIWRLESVVPGQSIVNWTAVHILVGGVLFVVLGWLIGHFVFGWWR